MERGDVTATTTPRIPSDDPCCLPHLTHLLRVLWCFLVTVKDFKLARATAELSRRGCKRFITRWDGAALTAWVSPEPSRQNIGHNVMHGICIIRYTAKREMRAIKRRNQGMLEKSEIENREKVLILMCRV